ncbi:MAG: hypothetical protein RIS47_1057 [Bacteroidota bacterium]|jgi:hypothetical protein
MSIMAKVFLGGTVNGSMWRDYVMPKLKIDYFNPVVKEWTEADYQRELSEREHCDYCVYVITPKMTGVYSIAEVIDDSNKRPTKTLYCVIIKDEGLEFSPVQSKSLRAVGKMVEINGGKWFDSLDDMVTYLNSKSE